MMFSALSLLILLPLRAFSLSVDADVTRGRLSEAFSSPSGKLTYSPEIVAPEPKDPTAILLQTNAVQGLSEKIRRAKASAAFVQGSLDTLRTFVNEQENARGGFPGPVPSVYCLPKDASDAIFSDICEIGAEGVLIPVNDGNEISSIDQTKDDTFVSKCKMAFEMGLQPIPELTFHGDYASGLSANDMVAIMDSLCSTLPQSPVAAVVTINNPEADDENPEAEVPDLPMIPKYQFPILNSIRATAGENRLGMETKRVKEAGFQGAFLRSDCLPGFRLNPDLDIVGSFWEACITDLKSTRSKSFSFRSKNNMDKSAMTKWENYQKSVLDSGALGDPNEAYSIVDASKGEYKGF